MRLSRMFVAGAIVALFGMFQATKAEAAAFTVDFCIANSAECDEDNLDSAILSFDEVLGGDPNDYVLTVTIDGEPTNTGRVDAFAFTISGVANETGPGYETKPSVLTDPAGTAGDPWVVFYDNINQGQDCTTDSGQANEVCVEGTGNGPTLNGANLVWTLAVNLADNVSPLSANSSFQLRIRFDQGVLSPGFHPPQTGQGGGGGGTQGVPEPASLTLFGLAALGAAYRLRRSTK